MLRDSDTDSDTETSKAKTSDIAGKTKSSSSDLPDNTYEKIAKLTPQLPRYVQTTNFRNKIDSP